MRLKQFIFALTAMLLSFSLSVSAQTELLVSSDYNSSTEGYGTSKFSNYAGAYAYAKANATNATIVIEKTTTLSGNTFDDGHENYSKLAVVIKDGATMGNALSKWDMTYPVTVEPGGTLTCARPINASVSNIHIKNTLTVGAKGATKKAVVDFLSDSYQDCDISIRYNGKVLVYNADFRVQDLDAQGILTIEDSKVEVDGAFASATFFKTTLTNTEMTVNGNLISGGLSDFAGGDSNQLGNVTINNSTLTIKEGTTKVASTVTAANSTIDVNNLTVNTGKTLNLNEGSTLEAEYITLNGTATVKVDGVAANVKDGVLITPKGNDFTGYTRGDAIWGEVWGNATESFVIKVLDANGNVMGTTSLNNIGGIIDGDVNVTWSLKFDAASNTDGYWTMEWTTAPTIGNMPAKVELWVDGVKVSGGNVVLNGPDNLSKIYAAVTDANGKILSFHTDVQEAIKAAAAVTSVAKTAVAGTVELLDNVTVDKWIMFAEKMTVSDGSLITLNINGVTIDGNHKTLTVKSIESAGNGGYLFYDAQNLTVKDLTINIADGLVGGIGLQSGTISNVTFNGGQYAVLPGSNGVTIEDCTFIGTNGYAVYYENERPGIVVTGNTFNTADGAYAITMRSNEQFTNNTVEKGRVNLANSATSTVSGNDFGTERFKVYNGATATIEDNKINNLVFNDASVVNSTFADNTLSPAAQTALAAAKFPVAKIGETKYATLAEAVAAAQSGATITLMNGEHELPLFSGKELTFVGESKEGVIVNDAPAAVTQGWNGSTFHFENLTAKGATENYHGLANGVVAVTYKNCNINGLRFLYATDGVSFEGCAFNAQGVEHSFWTYGASNVTVKNSTFTYTDRAVNCYSENGANHEADITFEGCSFTYAGTNDAPAGAVEINSGSVKSIDLTMNNCNAPAKGAMWFNSQWDGKKGENTVVAVNGEIVWQVLPAARVNGVEYKSLQAALDAAAAGTGNVTVEILRDVDLTGIDWNPVTVSGPGYPLVTVEGNNKTITGLNDMLFAGTWAGNSGLIIKNLTIADSEIVNDKDDSAGNKGVGAFIGFPQASATITLENCHLKNSRVEGGHWTGGLFGYAAGYAGNDGPVFMNLTVNGCSVTESTIIGKGSVGGIIGHGSGNGWTNVVIENTTVSGNTITSTGSSTNKAGAVMGTIGAAGQPTTTNGVTKTGGATVSATVAGNTVKSNNTVITTIYGRQGTPTGMLYLNGGTYDNNPIEDNVAYAKPAEGYKIEQSTDGTYGVVVDPAYGKVAKIGDNYYATINEAIAAAQPNDVVKVFEGTYPVPAMKAGITVEGAVNADGTPAVLLEGTLSGTLEDLTLRNLHIKGGNAQRWAYAKGDLVFENVTFEATSVYAIHFDGINEGTNLLYKDCTIIGWAAMGGSPASCVFDGCTIKDNGTYGVIRTYFDTTIENCTFDVANANTGDIYQDGIHAVDGAEIVVDSCTNANGEMKDLVNVSGASVVTVDGVEFKNVAKIGDSYYATINEAIAAAQPGETVKVFAGTYPVPAMKAGITVEGAVNADGTPAVLLEGTLSGTLEDLTLKNLHIKGGNAQRWAYAKGDLVFENVTFEATSVYAIHFDGITEGANLTYNNCTIIGWAAMSGSPASCVFEGCTIKDNGTYGVIRTYFDATIKDCTFDVANANTGDVYQDGIHAVDGAEIVVDSCTNANGEMKDLVNVSGASVVTVDGVEFKNVAKIGDSYYATLAEAVAAAQAGETVTLLADVALTETLTVPAGKKLTIDLNGKTISQTKEQTAGYQMILNDGNLTINDSSEAKTGKISYTDSGNGGEYISDVIYNRGVLVINGGTIENLSSATVASNGYPHAVDTYSGIRDTYVEINGGTIYCAEYSAIRMFCVSATNKADLVINGGTIKGAIDMQNGTKNLALGTLTINDGTFETTKNANNIRFANWNGGATEYGISAEIKGGSFNGGITTAYVPAAANWDKGVITGGTFAKDMTEYCAEGFVCQANGDGTFSVADDPTTHYIADVDGLKAFRDDVNAGNPYEGVTVHLTADIDLAGENWTPIGNINYDSKYKPADASKVFSGVFNGNGKVISNLKVESTVGGADTQANVGLFGITGEGAVIKNLTLTNVNIETDGRNVGAIAGFAYKATLDSITVNGNIQIKGGNNVAGIAGMTRYYDMSATDITVRGDNGSAIVGNNIVGGIFAEIAPNGSVQEFKGLNVENVAITGVGGVGGIVGLLTTGAVENVSVKNVVLTGRTDYQGNAMGRIRLGSVAGLMGSNSATIANETVENVTAKNLDGNAVELPVIGANYDAASNATEAKIGNTYYNTLLTALNKANENDTIVLISNIAADKIDITKSITIDGNGKTLTYTGTDRAIDVPNNANANIDVTIKNLTVVATTANRGLNYNENGKFNVEGVTVTIGENVDGYAINFPGMADGAQVTIKDSKLTSRNPLNIWGENMVINVYDSEIISVDNSTTYDYAAIQLNNEIPTVGPNGAIANGTVVNVYGGTITALNDEDEPSNAVANATETGVVNISNETVVTGKVLDYVANIGGVYFGSLQAAVNTIEKQGYNGPIVIMKSFATSETTTVNNGLNVTINLNGKTITGTDNATGSFGLITNMGNLTITDSSEEAAGKITLTATQNRGWNAYSSVISNTVGGKLTIDGGTLEHLGGTDMAYGIDNLTNGKGTYAETVINNGTIKSTYRGIRQFLNGIEAQNKLTINGGTVEGANKSVWMQDPNKNANTGTLTVGENAKLVGDAYLTVTAGSTEWPVEVSIAAAALQGVSKVMTSNVPAGYELAKINNTYSVALASDLSASVNGIGYKTLAEAITAAQSGDVITLLADITENVTINKNVTIDGADKKYTGTMTGNAGLTVTVQKVNFVNGGFAKSTKNATGNYTFKNCTFDGATTYAYPLLFKGANKVVVDSCTVRNYLYSFLYVTSSTNTVSVKNVTVEDCPSYAVYFSSGVTTATFENLTVKNSNNGFVINNTANRAFTIKDCKMENVTTPINHANGTNTITCTALGVNDFGTDEIGEYAVINGATITGTTYYGSVKGMVEKAVTGDTVKLLSNITLDATGYEMASCDGYPSFVHVEGKAITVDLNGMTIEANVDADDVSNFVIGVFSTDNGGELTLVDSSAEGTGKVILDAEDGKAYSLICNYEDGCKITINGGTYKATKVIDCLVYSGGKTDALVTVNGGNFTLGNVGAGENGKPWIFNVLGAGDHHVLVKGGTFNADINRQHWSNEVYVAKECYTVANTDGTYTVNEGAVAYVNMGMLTGPYFVRKDVGYATLGEAFAAADDDETVTLLKNIKYNKETGFINDEYVDGLVYTGDKNFTVDFAGHTITDENSDINDYLVYLKNTGEKDNVITFKNGTIAVDSLSTATAWAAITVGSGSSTHKTTLNLDSMEVVNGNPNDVNNQVIRSRNGATVNLNDGTLVTSNGTSYGVVAETTATVNINDGAKVVHTNSKPSGGNQVYTAVSGNGTINVYDGAEIVSDNYGIHNMTSGNAVINIEGGTITAPVIVRAATNGRDDQSADVYISGGRFFGAMEEYTENANIHVSGGVFDRPVHVDFCAEGYAPCDNADGTFGVYYAVLDEVHFVDGQFTEYTNSRNMTVGTLTYERYGVSTGWNQLYVPFEVPVSVLADQGFEVAYINGVRRNDNDYDGELDNFVMEVIYIHGGNADGSAKTLKANYPYFIRYNGEDGNSSKDLTIELEDVMLYAAKNATFDCTTFTEKFEITGTTKTVKATDFEDGYSNKYGVNAQTGKWRVFGETATMRPFRFYMAVTSREDSSPIVSIRSMSIVVRGEELPDGTTLIYDINAETGDNVIYDLNGRRVLETEKGNIYIINGKKVLVK